LEHSPFTLVALVCAGLACTILTWFVIRRPPLDRHAKVWLLFGLGVFPLGAAGAANIQGYEATQKREFCGSCHVMTPYSNDSANKASLGLASRHARNDFFGSQNCYSCHADYGMYGTVLTKMGGMRHVWLYYTEFHGMSLEEARAKIHLVKPYPNANCMHCHSTELQGWQRVPEHRSSLQDVRAQRMSCASPGCHGFAHPFSKPEGALPAELSP
jgi:nitrate/TMAO reductase-like tetraheme cytochrome c subunit